MLAVIICSLCNVAMLIGLLAGIVAGLFRARSTINEALTFALLAPVRTSPAELPSWRLA